MWSGVTEGYLFSTPAGSNAGTIAGAVIGVLLGLLLIAGVAVGVVFLVLKMRNKSSYPPPRYRAVHTPRDIVYTQTESSCVTQ